MKKVEVLITCDGCGEPIVCDKRRQSNDYLELDERTIPMFKMDERAAAHNLPSLDWPFHFHGIPCMKKWIENGELTKTRSRGNE